jgi:hypothetical protein
MAKLNYYGLVPNNDGTFTCYAIDEHAKQNFFGWGSDQNRIDGSFYGRDAKTVPVKLKGRLAPGDSPWQWKLDHDNASEMLRLIEKHGDDSNYYDADSKKRLPDLVEVLKFVLEGGA